MRDCITREIPGKDNAGLRAIVRAAAHDNQQGIGYDTPETIAHRIGRQVALTASGRARVLAALRALEGEAYPAERAAAALPRLDLGYLGSI